MLLLTPGPTPVPPEVRAALGEPAVPHRAAAFEAALRGCCHDLAQVFRNGDHPVLCLAGSGTTAFEAAQLSLANPGDRVLTCAAGKFADRWEEVYARAASRFGLHHDRLSGAWGEPIQPDALEEALAAAPDTRVVCAVHSETSTGTLNDVRALAAMVRRRAPNALLIVDGISSVGALPLEQEAWDVDVVVSASQKAFMLPPGLGFVGLGPRALARLEETEGIAPLSLDLRRQLAGWERGRAPFTPATSLVAGLRVSLDRILAESIEAVWARTRRLAEATRTTFREMGLALASSAPADSVTAAWWPEGIGDEVRDVIRERDAVVFAGGQGPWKGKVLRMSHMGAVGVPETIRGIDALARALVATAPPAGLDPTVGPDRIRTLLSAGGDGENADSRSS